MSSLKFDIIRRKSQTYDMTIISNIYKERKSFNCLIDTGASVPVWCAGEQLLKVYYPDCTKLDAAFSLHGFGTGQEIVPVYVIPQFVLSDGKQCITYKNITVAVTKRDFTFDLILSYSLFNKMNISINTFTNRNGSHSVVPNVKITSFKDTYYVGYKKVDLSPYDSKKIVSEYGTKNILQSVFIFNQQQE
ncbi:MAG: hypothetical protein NC548_33925 [Lachnospiraceae bacterium]|nr:hypothetical protein [Lachnospiraceae bacterium]